ncbi:DnaB-like helicase N-terminal domain-containing protein [Pseudonocardia sp. WMMC193]|uniref:DnaB-like helicase N-terminal domain-containing protein n=1 Tax=Pseudonocardia sp. WMMC193 TaxID=2911965 RepID=UPI001F21C902|nr:DnaB-like helicase N-terminal domain-containing protein [Pseudonocardia sp. WMMC193]MCF7547220.1 hypothetical protein [Pseudonocardia sp. WMMC193]
MSVTHAEDPDAPSASDLAAGALIGALLWDPNRTDDVSAWLQPDDFAHWAHRAIYETLTGLRRDGRPTDVLAVHAELALGTYHDVPVGEARNGALAAPALHTLLSSTPSTPEASVMSEHGTPRERSEHVRYGRAVLEASVRRRVIAAGSRIQQQTRHAVERDADAAADTVAPLLRASLARLDELATRISSASGSRILEDLSPTSVTGKGSYQGADAGIARERLTPRVIAQAEQNLIGSCLVSAELRDHVAGRLLPEDFTSKEAAGTWQVVADLAQRGEPVDYVLVALESERLGPEGRATYQPSELARITRRTDVASGYRAADVVLRAALAAVSKRAGRELVDLAGDRRRTGPELLRGARAAVAGAEVAARRLGGHSATTAASAFHPPAPRAATGTEHKAARREQDPPRGKQQQTTRSEHQRRR